MWTEMVLQWIGYNAVDHDVSSIFVDCSTASMVESYGQLP